MFLPNNSVEDMSGNSFVGLTANESVMATIIDIDLVPPSLVEFTLDLTAGTLQLTFDESVNIIDLMQLTIQANGSVGEPNVTLSGGDFTALTPEMNIFEVVLTDDDLNAVKSEENLAVSESTDIYLIKQRLSG